MVEGSCSYELTPMRGLIPTLPVNDFLKPDCPEKTHDFLEKLKLSAFCGSMFESISSFSFIGMAISRSFIKSGKYKLLHDE